MLSNPWQRLLLKPAALVLLGLTAILTQFAICVNFPGFDVAAFGTVNNVTTTSGASFGCTFRYWWQVTCE